MIVMSAFDGMSCGQIALERVGIKPDLYLASENDKYPIAVTQSNYPDTIQIGDIQQVSAGKVDLLIGGSPCQGFSSAGKRLGFKDPRSRLFYEYVRLLNESTPTYFILENVKMKKEDSDIITSELGVDPISINSRLVSAQNRERLYLTNIPVSQPCDKGITWGDIRQHGLKNFYYSDKGLAWIRRHSERTGKQLRVWGNDDKCQMIEANHHKNYSSQRFFGIEDVHGLRYISPVECERAQTVPDGYTAAVSNTRRYMMLGNGWTVDVIAHILKGISC